MRRSNKKEQVQRPKLHPDQRGVLAARRTVSNTSYEVFERIETVLQPELINVGRLFVPKLLGVTVVGYSQFSARHRYMGPATEKVVGKVDSARRPLEVGLGKLGIFGSDKKTKLGIEIISPELEGEEAEIKQGFEDSGFRLKSSHNNQGFSPHCSIALLYNDNLRSISDPRNLGRYNRLTNLSSGGLRVVLDPIIKE